MNINHFIRKNQKVVFSAIGVGVMAIFTLLWWINRQASGVELTAADSTVQSGNPSAQEPDLTGAITNTFDNKVQGNVVTDAQLSEKANRQTMDVLLKEIQGIKRDFDAVKNENSQLKANVGQLQAEIQHNKKAMEGENSPTPGASQVSHPPQIAILPPKGQLESTRFTYPKKENMPSGFYVPSGTFSTAIVLEGADANASVKGETKKVAMQFKLTGLAHLPGNQKLNKLTNCFVTASAWGEISSERAEVRLERLSCVINNKHIDQVVEGHVGFYGKNGIKGIPVMRNGAMLGLAFGAGALGGLGNAFSQIGNTTVGMGATHQATTQEVARQALGSGASTAANKLADYYIERAEQYHPVIPIGAANRVEVVFQKGFKAEFIEDLEAKKVNESPTQLAKNVSNSVKTNLPPELLNQLGSATSMDLSDFVTPTKPPSNNGGVKP
ncbi:TrbI/VirB10 family protein [Arsenophonus nasoniae]|uniref:TrbI/VirB10 family protein n=1 Tax=Arsenophonus nasoniae TaxID=638 RepID=A0ABY8NYX1_9GAMM|nr:TrbI/VirB10 family protein [Arsenophonus nasoniae]WGM08840.1 TrbI/VirB10 family protein [Arsenophonus nasoniae]